MSTNRKFLQIISIIVILATMLSGFQSPSASAQGKGNDIKREVNAETGKVSFIGPESGQFLSASEALGPTSSNPADPAMALAKRFASEFGVQNPEQDLTTMRSKETEDGRVTVRYQQNYQGIPVMGGEVIVNTNKNGDLYSMNGEASQNLSLQTQPTIDSAQASDTALQAMAKWYQASTKDFVTSEPQLWIFDESLLKPSDRPAELVWRMEVTSKDDSMPVRELVVVNAERGSISLHFNQIDEAWGEAQPEKTSKPDITMPKVNPPTIKPTVKDSMPNLSGNTWYVATTGDDANDCATTITPCATINGAIGKAADDDTILVAEGTYTGSGTEVVLIDKSITLSGGWDSTFNVQNSLSVIDGQSNLYGIVTNGSNMTITVSQFVVQNCNTGIFNKNFDGTSSFNRLALVNNSYYGIYNYFGKVYIENTTISNSKVIAIFNFLGNINIQHSTITNTAGDYAVITSSGSTQQIVIGNSILAGNDHKDCTGNIISEGYNIFGSSPPCDNLITLQSSDQIGTDPHLGVLLPNGYHWLLSSSPAINAANPAICPGTDQRGVERPQDSTCDIGAYEVAAPGTVTDIVLLSGNFQRAAPNSTFPKYLKVAAVDGFGGPVGNVNVIFTAPSSGASGTFSYTGTNTTSTSTNIDGMAIPSQFTANNELGNYVVFVSSDGLDNINFDLENGAWYVSPAGNDSNACNTPILPCATIDVAISKATDDDTILVAEGTYTGSGTQVVLINKSVTLSGGWDGSFNTQAGKSIIDGQEARRGVAINPPANVVINHFLIQNGIVYNSSGGGIINGGTLTILDSNIINNTAGGIHNYGTLTISSSNINNNKDSGISNSGTATITDSIVSNNIAGRIGASGGGLEGGGIKNYGTMVLNNSTISGNIMLGFFYGSGIYNNGTLTLNSSTVSGNTGTESIHNGWNNLMLNNSTVSNNPNGGIDNLYGTVTLNNSTISNNLYGIYNQNYDLTSSVSISNSILAQNKNFNCKGFVISNGHNLIGNTSKCTFLSSNGDLINASPLLNPNLIGSPAYRVLMTGSPAINAGNPATCPLTDQRGAERVGICDIGAYEYNTPGVSVIAGTSQATSIKHAFPKQFQILVVDESNHPVGNALVVFTAPSNGPSGIFSDTKAFTTTAITDADGVAVAPVFTANALMGTYLVVPSVSGLSTVGTIELTNILAPIKTYTTDNSSELPGDFLCGEMDLGCVTRDNHAKKAHEYAAGIYTLYKDKHNRNSIDNNYMTIVSTVHYKSNYANAFWDGKQIVYGDAYGFPLADDVVAHELTHGITQYESNLFYFYQSGAINESFSDLWGEYYDQTNHLGNDASNVKWLIGEDVTGLGAMRSMKNPPQFGDPDKLSSSNYVEDISDNGGVHSNSGINNKAVYLMVDGGTFNGKTITKLGWDKTAAIYYEANTILLASGSDYSDLYYALQQACSNLIGQKDITSNNCIQVKNALLAVEMDKQPATNFNLDATLCAANLSPLNIFQDNFESGEAKWTKTGTKKIAWSLEDDYATSPTHMLYGDDTQISNDSIIKMKTGIFLPAGSKAFLHFDHAFLFDYSLYQGANYYYDGGVLEYSINNGSTWKDAKPLFSAGQNYKGTILNYQGTTNKLKGRPAFVGDSHGYVSSLYDLSSLAGKKVQFRWRLATDSTVALLGWFVDDVQIYTCVGKPSKPTLLLPATDALVTDYTPDLDWSNSTPKPDHYQVQIATDNKFTALVYNQNNLPSSSFTVPTDLDPNTTFYWRARAFNVLNKPGAWSTAFSFRTVMAPPVLLTPTDGEIIATLLPELNWEDVAGGTGYLIQVSDAPNFVTKLVNINVTDSTYQVPSDLPPGVTLYWRVRATGPNGPSDWSVFSFVTP